MSRHFVNTDLFRDAARHFERHGYYCNAPEGTREWEEYWDEELRRCREGYSVGGVRITGNHYFYLNFSRIKLVKETEEITARRSGSKVWGFPAFWDWDYNYFHLLEIARHGISEEDYRQLDLDVKIRRDHLVGGKHVVVVKGRRQGYSHKAGSMLARQYAQERRSKCYAMASEWEYLLGDGLLSKAWDNIDFIDTHTAWASPRLIDLKYHKRSGYKRLLNGAEVADGRQSEIMGISLKDDPDKARGKDGQFGLFEEAGKFPGLLKAWSVCRESYEQGAVTTGLMIAYGTGGTEGANYEGLEELFGNPDAHNVLAVENMWDEGAEGTYCSFFVPAYMNREGFMDRDGNSDTEGARAFFEAEREKKRRSSKGSAALEQYIAENPFTPREATLNLSTNLFPTAELLAHLGQVKAKQRWGALTPGILMQDEHGKVVFRPDKSVQLILDFPTPKDTSTDGGVYVLESPWRDQSGNVPQGLYTICHDPYAHDGQAEGGSLGSAFVLKRTNNFTTTYPECIVAGYVGRPSSLDEYNRNLFLLAEYYNCRIGYEANRGEAVLAYAKRFRKLHYLEEEPQLIDKRDSFRKTPKAYGLTMTKERKNQGELYLRDWLLEPIKNYEDGSTLLRLHTILDPALLSELIKYNQDGNFDRVLSLFVGMYYLKDKEARRRVVQTQANPHADFFEREWFGSSRQSGVYSLLG